MKKHILITYIVLLAYTIVHVVFFFSNEGILGNLIRLEADPLLVTMFNLLGIYGLAYLIYSIKYVSPRRLDLIPLVLGFGLGAFVITPMFIKKRPIIKNDEKWVSLIALIGVILSITLLGFGLILGDYQLFIKAFMGDSFIHIMTIDFIFLTILSILISKPISKHYYLAGIPLVGFLYILFSE